MGKLFDICSKDGISSGGSKVKFRWKLMIVTMLIVSFSFGFGGMLLIKYSYEASIKQEKKSARGSYEMILRMLKEIDEMDDTYQNQTLSLIHIFIHQKKTHWQRHLRIRLMKKSKKHEEMN